MRAKPVLALIPALVLMTGCDFEDMDGFSRHHEDFHFNYPLKTGGRLAVQSFNGSIEISPWDQENIDISGTKYARSPSDIADIKIEIDHTADSVSIRATRPMTRNGNHGARFVIKVPRSAVLDRVTTSNGAIRASDGVGPGRFKTSNGGIHVFGFRGELNADTSNGTIELNNVDGSVSGHTSNGKVHGEALRGALDFTTSNGGIELTLAANTNSPVRAHTSNSGITLRLPGEINARISANTSNGSVSSDFEMRMRGEINRHHLEGTLGSGGPLIDLSTSNGSIRLVR